MKLKGFIYSLCFLVSCFLILFIVASIAAGLRIQNFEMPVNIGNSEENLANVSENVDANDFTFIVAGDVKGGTATFEAMLNTIAPEKPDFMVILGDLVCSSTEIAHKLFAFEMSEHCKSMPGFMVAGNHDIDIENDFDITDFEKIYNQSEFSFCIGEYLFVFLNNNRPYCDSEEYVDYLESAIKAKEGEITKTFVFMHVPPITFDGSLEYSGLGGSERFMEVAKKYHVDYVFMGDHHAYVKQEKDETNYIITGGGGARLRGESGRFYHMMRISVVKGKVSETVILGEKHIETAELLERNMVIYVWPMISRDVLSMFLTGVMLIFSFLVCIYTFRKHRGLKRHIA